ncbi:MAG: SpoIID/LytB domain-containing protein [Deltaproteobacteria bacterium]|nr:SpoIID/LytB domain-containing protein [Deltaproteobacteria bacterium]
MHGGEPKIRVGIMEGRREIHGCFHGVFLTSSGQAISGDVRFSIADGKLVLCTGSGAWPLTEREFRCRPQGDATFSLHDVTIGVNFHWQRQETQTFQGALSVLVAEEDTLTAVNELTIEDYLGSVISSEMSAAAPLEFLKAHTVTSRSWLMAMLEKKEAVTRNSPMTLSDGEIIRWYGREEHARFDVCADDHCQRYQGVTKIITDQVRQAIDVTRGLFLVYDGGICDARYHKACGGRTEDFANVWEDVAVPYLISVSDGPENFPPAISEEEAEKWINSSPTSYCNTNDSLALRQVLPSFDQETTDFFRWEVSYAREELETLLLRKSGIDFGELHALIPLDRGPSGRIIRLKIEGSKRTVIVGKELEIRRWLSSSHLYSSAFIVRTERDGQGKVVRFTLKGAGWGHGVGLCQIGAAMMAMQGFGMEDILGHYFRGATLRKLY